MFIGRGQELKALNERYNRRGFEFIPIYGRRRVGKTSLIKEFIKDKKAIFFTAAESGRNHNLQGLSSVVYEAANGVTADISYNSFDAVFDAIFELSQKGKLVFVIDEYPYLAQSYAPISSILQKYIDMKFKDTDMFIILCGSSMSFMEHQVLGYKSPLYGRRTGQLKIEPFNFKDSCKFHERFSKVEQAIVYGITGGIPKYLEVIDDKRTLKENIIRAFLTTDAMLFEEPSNLLKQELREPQTYNDIITAISGGASKMSEIVKKSNIDSFDSSKCNKYLNTLISLGLIKKELPILSALRRKSIYRVSDGMFRFWYKFIPQNITRIQLGQSETVYSRIEPHISDFMGEVFEDICKQWLWNANFEQNLPFEFQNCGRWWGANPKRKEEMEIDIIASDESERKVMFCECKWTNAKVGRRLIDNLIEKSEMFNYEDKFYMLFSKSGFKGDTGEPDRNNVYKVNFSDMY